MYIIYKKWIYLQIYLDFFCVVNIAYNEGFYEGINEKIQVFKLGLVGARTGIEPELSNVNTCVNTTTTGIV